MVRARSEPVSDVAPSPQCRFHHGAWITRGVVVAPDAECPANRPRRVAALSLTPSVPRSTRPALLGERCAARPTVLAAGRQRGRRSRRWSIGPALCGRRVGWCWPPRWWSVSRLRPSAPAGRFLVLYGLYMSTEHRPGVYGFAGNLCSRPGSGRLLGFEPGAPHLPGPADPWLVSFSSSGPGYQAALLSGAVPHRVDSPPDAAIPNPLTAGPPKPVGGTLRGDAPLHPAGHAVPAVPAQPFASISAAVIVSTHSVSFTGFRVRTVAIILALGSWRPRSTR